MPQLPHMLPQQRHRHRQSMQTAKATTQGLGCGLDSWPKPTVTDFGL